MKLSKAGRLDWRKNWHRATVWNCGCFTCSGSGEKLMITPCGDSDCDVLSLVLKHNHIVKELAEAGKIPPQSVSLFERPLWSVT